MNTHKRTFFILLLILGSLLLLAACGNNNEDEGRSTEDQNNLNQAQPLPEPAPEPAGTPVPPIEEQTAPDEPAAEEPVNQNEGTPPQGSSSSTNEQAVEVVANPEAITVLINKQFALPEEYEPSDLTEPNVPFLFKEKLQKRLMRKEAADALEKLFAAAEEDGIKLAGASGYRSYATQKSLFASYVQRDGEEAASRYSARPGHSEHSTGLAMDVSGISGKCAVKDCFGDTEEAKWLGEHVYEHGFIIRYPQGKEDITGYKYEPWHLRYVGLELAVAIKESGLTLEEYYDRQSTEASGEPVQP